MGRLVSGVVIIEIRFSPAILECPALSLNTLFNLSSDDFGHEGRLMMDMQVVAEQNLQRILAALPLPK